ncbi:hypothetical protein HOL24_01950 [bacterium]|nr:hypothetical protein [bacterium]
MNKWFIYLMVRSSLGRVVTIIQARMGSSRFPGKMVEKLNNYPLMEWVIRRSQQAANVDDTVLATSNRKIDDVLVEIANKCGCHVFRGSEDDVLGRYVSAAEEYKADTIIRVCGDRPLVDPAIIDTAIELFKSDKKISLAYNHISGDGQNWPRGFGVEVFETSLLKWMDEHLDKQRYREHVTPYIWENKNFYFVTPVKCPFEMDLGVPDVKLDVDTKSDLLRLRRVCLDLDIDMDAKYFIKNFKESGEPLIF